MIFADLALARRLERPEALGGVRFIEAHQRIQPDSKAAWIEQNGTYAMYDGPDSPVTQTFGLGLFADLTADALTEIESFFFSRNAPVNHEVSPLVGIPVVDLLARRGYRPVELTSVLYLPLASVVTEPRAVKVRLLQLGEEDLWAGISARGWSQIPEFQDYMLGLGRAMVTTEGSQGFFAEIGGQPVATGMLRIHEGVALFAGASTVPESRNKGAQRALFQARLDAAKEQGCDLAMVCAEPGSASQRNAERQGFRIAYTRTKWQLRAPV